MYFPKKLNLNSELYLLKLKEEINNELYALFNKREEEIDFKSNYANIFNLEELEMETEEVPIWNDLIEKASKKHRKYNERAPLKKLTSSEKALDFKSIAKILKKDFNKRNWIKNFMEGSYSTHIYTRRSELIIDNDTFKINEEIELSRMGIKKDSSVEIKRIFFDPVFTERNQLIYSKPGKIVKIFPEQIVVKIKNEEVKIKIDALKREEFIIKKIEN